MTSDSVINELDEPVGLSAESDATLGDLALFCLGSLSFEGGSFLGFEVASASSSFLLLLASLLMTSWGNVPRLLSERSFGSSYPLCGCSSSSSPSSLTSSATSASFSLMAIFICKGSICCSRACTGPRRAMPMRFRACCALNAFASISRSLSSSSSWSFCILSASAAAAALRSGMGGKPRPLSGSRPRTDGRSGSWNLIFLIFRTFLATGNVTFSSVMMRSSSAS
mmetsp:Transcript_109849/g.309794  ORF Transcript_109849/g.309794 Transcript_109849/m.309794 type:complete len:225 (+) Transcript_109849:300-974(+)